MTSADSHETQTTPRWIMWFAYGALALLAVWVVAFVVHLLSEPSDPAGSEPSAAPTVDAVEQQYLAIVSNQGGLIADQQTMVNLGREACQSLGFGIGSAQSNRQMAVGQFVLSHDDVTMKQAEAIITAASGSGLCTS